jgi:hypothetical protein
MSDEEIGFERIGMVIIERGALFEAQIIAIAVVPIVFEYGHLVIADALDDAADDRCLAGSGATGDADDERQASRVCLAGRVHPTPA